MSAEKEDLYTFSLVSDTPDSGKYGKSRQLCTYVLVVVDLPHRGGLDDAIVALSVVIQYSLGATLQGDSIAGDLLDLDRGRLVVGALRASGTGRGAAQRVAIDLPHDPPLLAVVERVGIDSATVRIVADQRLRKHLERAVPGRRSGRANTAPTAVLLARNYSTVILVIGHFETPYQTIAE